MDQPSLSQKIVIVEDNTALADIYKTRLELIGYACFVANDGLVGLELIKRELPDLVLLDLMVPKIAGDQILETMRASDWGKDIRVLIVSNLNEADAPAGLRAQGIEGYAVKANLSNDQLDRLVDNILKPADQKEDVSLEKTEPDQTTVRSEPTPVAPPPASTAQPAVPAPAPASPAPAAPVPPQPPRSPMPGM